MRVATVLCVAICFVTFLTALIFSTDHSSTLPNTSFESSRREALQTPFHAREHRLERQPRLEAGVTDEEQNAAKQVGSQALKEKQREISASSDRQQVEKRGASADDKRPRDRFRYHVIPTVDGSVYTEWQVRICYYWYKKMKAQYPDSALGGFTRLLHSGRADNLTEEIPTVVVNPLPPGVDEGYVVLNRPFAFLQWVREYMPKIPEDYILMAEPDHLFVKPLPMWATPTRAAAFPFSYIKPLEHTALVNRFNDKNVSAADMAPIGNAPVQMHRRQLEGIVENWHNTSLRMKRDPEVSKAFGWILEMYAFSIASSQAEGGPIVFDLRPEMMGQPPFDPFLELRVAGKSPAGPKVTPICLIHLTYGMDYDAPGTMVYGHKGNMFHWDKRDYSQGYPPRNLPMPPPSINAPAVRHLLTAINEATDNLPWPNTASAAGR